ncbi:MAG: glycoside hydrolase family protein [Candidatus Borkfalkiaceae bacterium]|nr:glycoside hydrolase family protein [Christensenellaceae bacterium]
MEKGFGYRVGKATVALRDDGYYFWDSSVVRAKGKYHLFCSRWKKEYGFGWNWLFNSEIVRCVSDKPEGPYAFANVVLPRRGREYFDGMNTHNACIREYGGRFYLYYMGTTYGGAVPTSASDISLAYAEETWNRKRIGLAVADDIEGEFVRRDLPLLEPRDCRFWDCTATTNPSVAILPDGKTYMIYKSRRAAGETLRLGVAVADKPDGEFRRLTDDPLFDFADGNMHVEDPFLWYDEERKKFCLIAKDDPKNGSHGVTGEWGSGFYAESDDCIRFRIGKNPKVYSRTLQWADGRMTTQGNLERPSLLFEGGRPSRLFCAGGVSERPYDFTENTFVVCMDLEKTD